MTKRVRLYEALKQRQNRDKRGNLVVAFIQESMNPVRHTEAEAWFDSKRVELKKILAFAGNELNEVRKCNLVRQPTCLVRHSAERVGALEIAAGDSEAAANGDSRFQLKPGIPEAFLTIWGRPRNSEYKAR